MEERERENKMKVEKENGRRRESSDWFFHIWKLSVIQYDWCIRLSFHYFPLSIYFLSLSLCLLLPKNITTYMSYLVRLFIITSSFLPLFLSNRIHTSWERERKREKGWKSPRVVSASTVVILQPDSGLPGTLLQAIERRMKVGSKWRRVVRITWMMTFHHIHPRKHYGWAFSFVPKTNSLGVFSIPFINGYDILIMEENEGVCITIKELYE